MSAYDNYANGLTARRWLNQARANAGQPVTIRPSEPEVEHLDAIVEALVSAGAVVNRLPDSGEIVITVSDRPAVKPEERGQRA